MAAILFYHLLENDAFLGGTPTLVPQTNLDINFWICQISQLSDFIMPYSQNISIDKLRAS